MAQPNCTIITLNVQGLRNPNNRKTFFSWLNCAKPDIVAIQETHSTSCDEFHSWVRTETRENNNLHGYHVESSPGTQRSAGVAILHKPSFKASHVSRDTTGRCISVNFSHTDATSSFHLLNIYGPNQKHAG